jgi:hypothetical protein
VVATKRRIGGLLLIFGYLGVVAGSIAWIVSYWDEPGPEGTIYQAALCVGLVMAGVAGWRWTVTGQGHGMPDSANRAPARWMSGSAFVLAAAPAALTYNSFDLHRQMSRFTHSVPSFPHYRLIMVGGIAFTAGLTITSGGFAILSLAASDAFGDPNVVEVGGVSQCETVTNGGTAS